MNSAILGLFVIYKIYKQPKVPKHSFEYSYVPLSPEVIEYERKRNTIGT